VKTDAALLIIDVQIIMFHEQVHLYQPEELLANLNDLISRARSAGAPVIYIQQCGAEGSPIAPGSPGWPIHPAIAPATDDLVIQKHFPDSFFETSLQTELDNRGIKKLIVAGLQSEYCIDTTCRRAFSMGYKITLVEDAHSTWNNKTITAPQIIAHHNEVLSKWFVNLQNAKDVEFMN